MTQLKSSPRVPLPRWLCLPGGCGAGGQRCLGTTQHPDTSPGCSHPCLLHSALQQGSPRLLGSVYTSLWTQSPVFIYTGRNKGKQIKKEAGTVSICSAPEHPAHSTAETCCCCSSLLGTACPARASSCVRSWYLHHTEIQSPLCLIYHCAWPWRKVGCGDFCTRQCTLLSFSLLCAGWFEAFLEHKNPKELIAHLHYL